MTIEEKSKAYDKAIEKIKYVLGHGVSPVLNKEDLQDIFPELSESEDEKIRKALLDYFSECKKLDINPVHDAQTNTILAWLEKQGDNPIKWYKNTKDYKPQKYHSVLMKTTHGIAEGEWNGEHWIQYRWSCVIKDSDVIAWMVLPILEKQGEQKPTDKVEPKFKVGDIIRFKGNETLKGEAETHKIVGYDNELYVFADGTTDLFCEQDLYELVNQKSADKVEPKFHEGEWITNGDYTWKIVEVKPLDYILQSQDGNIVDDTITHVDEQFHSFTIEDAKDGDIVVDKSDGAIGIFQSIGHHSDGGSYNTPSYCFLHCRYDDGFFYADFEHGNTIDSNDIIPASKEQRDTLFAKMKEAGYEWNFEKKELKKIEQKSQRMISAEVKEAMYDKPALNEKDEQHIDSLLKRLDGLCRNEFERTRFAISEDRDWLTSLKQRIGG